MQVYYCWITALSSSYQDGVITGLVKLGYMIGPASKDGRISFCSENNPASLLAFSIYKTGDVQTSTQSALTDTLKVLEDMKAYYYSIIIAVSGDAAWIGTNIVVKEKSPDISPDIKKNMN